MYVQRQLWVGLRTASNLGVSWDFSWYPLVSAHHWLLPILYSTEKWRAEGGSYPGLTSCLDLSVFPGATTWFGYTPRANSLIWMHSRGHLFDFDAPSVHNFLLMLALSYLIPSFDMDVRSQCSVCNPRPLKTMVPKHHLHGQVLHSCSPLLLQSQSVYDEYWEFTSPMRYIFSHNEALIKADMV